MPVYIYKCDICKTVFERRGHVNEEKSALVCPKNHTQIHRVYSAPNIIFKGSGFYINDSRAKNAKSKHE